MKAKPSYRMLMTLGVLLLAAALVQAKLDEDPHAHPVKQADPAQALSSEVRLLLVKEMQSIDKGMGELLSAISAGDWETAEAIAGKIQHSYILKQQLTERQVHELHEKLPAGFVQMDAQFHGTAGKLAAIARRRDAQLATFYYYRLAEGCVSCHASFAPRRFPGLVERPAADHQH